jgi:hypothetical protein
MRVRMAKAVVFAAPMVVAAASLAQTINVPGDFPTIQAAIDSVAAGQARTVQVAAGTYNESFALNGKNVVVRGAPKGGTVLDGTGLSVSIATFSSNEPSTAGLENLVFRNATSGTTINPPAPVQVGGAVLGFNSSAFIRNCRFEDCAAEFGGAVYLYNSSLDIDNCVFAGNDAQIDGGGMLAFRCVGSLESCTFTGNRAGLASAGSGSALKTVGASTSGGVIAVIGCTFSANATNVSGSAVEHFEDVEGIPGVLRLENCGVTGNSSGLFAASGAGGLRVLGRQQSCVLTGGTQVCSNTARNVSGPYLVVGSASVCDCEADIFENGFVDGGDLGVLLSSWGLSPSNGAGDLNHDGLVNAVDLATLLSAWGQCD